MAQLQTSFTDIDPARPVEVSLWSGGLDALAGLYSRIWEARDPRTLHVLFSTGANSYMEKVQREVREDVERRSPGCTRLIQAPIRLADPAQEVRNSTSRSRGLVFCLLGAACARLFGQDRLFVFENGIGAINLRYPGSDSATDHSRSLHPDSLRRVSELISALLDEEFRVENPFIDQTKAHMCSCLSDDSLRQIVSHTVSCDRRHRSSVGQCGYGSSCLLRRQALAAAGIQDETVYVLNSGMRASRPSDGDHLRAILSQVCILRQCLSSEEPWQRLAQYEPWLLGVAETEASRRGVSLDAAKEALLALYQVYVDEWGRVSGTISQGLLDSYAYPVGA